MKNLIALITLFLPINTAFSQSTITSFATDKLKVGKKTSAGDKVIEFESNLGAANPKIRVNPATAQVQFANDGVNYVGIGSGSGSGGGGINVLQNAGFESGITNGWTNTGGTFSAVTAGANLLIETRSATFDASATSQSVQSTAYTVPNGLKGLPCSASILYLGGDANLSLQVFDGSVVLANRTLVTATVPTFYPVPFVCPTSGTIQLRVISSADAALVSLDQMYLGQNNIFQLSQTYDFGSARQLGASGCIYSENTSTGLNNWVALGTGTGCNAWTTTGRINVVGTNDHRITASNIAAGTYKFTLTGPIINGAVAGLQCQFRLSDGTNTFNPQFLGQSSGNPTINALHFEARYAAAQTGTVTWTIQAADSGGNSCGISNDAAGYEANWSVQYYPASNDQAARLDTLTWIVDANISGANPSLGTAAVSTYTGIENGSLTLTNNSVPSAIAAQIPCSSTNAPTGVTCAVGNESLGVSFTVPQSGLIEACADFSWEGNIAASGNVNSIFQIVETPNNAQTILQEGKSRVQAKSNNAAGAPAFPLRVCGTLNLQQGQRTLRLMYEQAVTGTVNSSLIAADAAGTDGQRDVHWTVRPLTYGAGTAVGLLQGLVTSNSVGQERVERISITNSGTPTIARQSGSWVTSLTDGGVGITTLVIPSGIFSDVPTCVCNNALNGGGATCKIDGVPTATSVQIRTYSESAGTLTLNDNDATVICMGPR